MTVKGSRMDFMFLPPPGSATDVFNLLGVSFVLQLDLTWLILLFCMNIITLIRGNEQTNDKEVYFVHFAKEWGLA